MSVAKYLALTNAYWNSNDPEVLLYKNTIETLAILCDRMNTPIYEWMNNKDLLKHRTQQGDTIAHILAITHPTWTTDDPEILELVDISTGKTVRDMLEEYAVHKYINKQKHRKE